jgi:hypothetical protein
MMSGGVATSMMCAILDGMDQSKFRIPRSGRQQLTKLLEKLYRPVLHVSACWVHGCVLEVAVADEDLKKDSSTQQEVLARALNTVYDYCNWKLPFGLHVQQDNTYREGKNQYMLSFLIILVISNVFRWVSAGFLRTAHSSTAGNITTNAYHYMLLTLLLVT